MKEEMENRIERLNQFVPKEYQDEVREQIIAILETVQEEAFLDGYRYAVAVLNDGLIKKS
ncbi:MAG: hypothetical protein HFH13_06895 [Dorea sp.]|nr:hypothetical protein [Dorea sp.]